MTFQPLRLTRVHASASGVRAGERCAFGSYIERYLLQNLSIDLCFRDKGWQGGDRKREKKIVITVEYGRTDFPQIRSAIIASLPERFTKHLRVKRIPVPVEKPVAQAA